MGRRANLPPASEGRINIAFGVNMEIGGTELNAVRTAERLNPERFRVVAVCGDDGPLSERYRSAGIAVHGFPIPNLYGPTAARRGLDLVKLLRAQKIHIFHAHDVYSNIFGTFYARLARVPVTIASRRWWHTVPRPALNRLNRWVSRWATCVLANSPAVARMVEEEGVPASRIAVVPNFLDDSAFFPPDPSQRRAVLARVGVPSDALVVGCVANLSPVKNHASVIRAAHMLGTRFPGVHFVFLGEGPCRPELESHAKELGLVERIHFPGQWIRPWNLHGLFDISVLCSLSEGFPNSIIEAMAGARPVVATRVGGNVDAITDGETGLLVSAGEDDELAHALARLLSDPQLRQGLGAAAQRRARSEYSADPVIARLETIYKHLHLTGACPESVRRAISEASGGPGTFMK